MPFEDDPEAHAIAVRYAGRDFDKPQNITITVLDEYDREWTTDEFKVDIAAAFAKIPAQHLHTAYVMIDSGDQDTRGRFFICYVAPESPEVVSARIESCRLQVERERAKDLATYQRLKKKFEGDAG